MSASATSSHPSGRRREITVWESEVWSASERRYPGGELVDLPMQFIDLVTDGHGGRGRCTLDIFGSVDARLGQVCPMGASCWPKAPADARRPTDVRRVFAQGAAPFRAVAATTSLGRPSRTADHRAGVDRCFHTLRVMRIEALPGILTGGPTAQRA